MKFDICDRGKGKTTRLLEWLLDAPEGEHRVLVSHDRRTTMKLLREARDRGLPVESWQFVSFDEIRTGSNAFSGVLHGRGGHVVLGIDNADIILRGLTAWSIDIVTATGELAANEPSDLIALVK